MTYTSDTGTKGVVSSFFSSDVQLWTPMGYLRSVCADKYGLEDSGFNSEKFKECFTWL